VNERASRETMPVFEPNPPWLNRVISQSWPAIERRVGPELMPTTVPGAGRKIEVEELGCGHYGCVVPTGKPGIVMKLTSDPLEAHFVAAALRIGRFPLGIVHYASVYSLPAEYRQRQLFVLWREEANDVGALSGLDARTAGWFLQYDPYDQASLRHFRKRLQAFQWWASEFKAIVDRATDMKRTLAEMIRYEAWARELVDLEHVEDREIGRSKRPFPHLKGARRLAVLLRGCEILAEMMANESKGDLVGEALEFYLQNGLLLADVHAGNVGHVRRADFAKPVWAITDPGHAVPLDLRFETVTVDVV
jgi:hypothetical protein